jgi:hypothetical protein
MPEVLESSTEQAAAPQTSKFFEDAYASGADLTDKLVRETHLIGSGLVAGALAEIEHDPLKAGTQLALTAVVGTVLAAGAAAELPVIVSATALVAGAAATGKWLVDTFDPRIPANQRRNQAVSQAVYETWVDSSDDSFRKNEKIMQSNLGALGLDLSIFAASGGIAARFAPGFAVELAGGYRAMSAAGRNLSPSIADLITPIPSTVPGLKLALAEGATPAGRLPELAYLSDYVNFCEGKAGPEAKLSKSTAGMEPPPANDSVSKVELSPALPAKEPQGIIRKAESESDLAQMNRIQEELFAEDRLGEITSGKGYIVLERPGEGIVGYTNLGLYDQSLLYIGVLAEHRGLSRLLIKATLEACRKESGWWQSWLKESTAYPLFKSLAEDGYIVLRELGDLDVHPASGAAYHLVEFMVTNKEFNGIRQSTPRGH